MPSPELERARLTFIGGTGPEGRGLALRFASLGYPVTVGSRTKERAEEAAREICESLGHGRIQGTDNVTAAREGERVFLTIPYAGLDDTLPALRMPLRGKLVVSAVAPIEFEEGRPVARRPEAGSAAQEVQRLLPESRVVSAFQIVDAHRLQDVGTELDTDIIVCSDDVEGRREIVRMANELSGARAFSGGRLAVSRYVEECTALLITLNRIYKTHSGIRITGIDR